VQRNVEREFGRRVTRLVLPELKVTYLGVRGPWDAPVRVGSFRQYQVDNSASVCMFVGAFCGTNGLKVLRYSRADGDERPERRMGRRV
jgi:hypothetical protein